LTLTEWFGAKKQKKKKSRKDNQDKRNGDSFHHAKKRATRVVFVTCKGGCRVVWGGKQAAMG